MTELRAIEPADSTILDQWTCAVSGCNGAVGYFTNGDDEDGYSTDFAPGWAVHDQYFCAEHHDIAVEAALACAIHGDECDDEGKCVECYAEEAAQRYTDAYHAHLWATR